SAAIRLSHTIKLHRKCENSSMSMEENEQRKRVFWVAYFLDKETSLRSGRPSAQDDDDIDVELPSEDPADKIGMVPLNSADKIEKPSSNVFRSICAFAQIQSRVHKKLYSVRASQKSEQKLIASIGKLVHELEDWKQSIPTDFRPGHEIDAACWPYRLHVIFMNLAYHHCVTTIHRLSVHGDRAKRSHTQAMYSLDPKSSDARVSKSSAQCLQSARASIRLISPDTDELVIKAVYNLSPQYLNKGPVRIGISEIDRVAWSTRGYEYVTDMQTDPRVQYPEEAAREGIASMLSIGMRYKGRPIGVLRVYTATQRTFEQYELDLLKAIAAQASAAIENTRLLEERLAGEAVERQVRMAAEVQQRMLPDSPPNLPGIDIAYTYV
ncbi:MAG: GAF domain-containing protein, partial [Oxalobacteraceae bacterium]